MERATRQIATDGRWVALVLSVALHAGVLALASHYRSPAPASPKAPQPGEEVMVLEVVPLPPADTPPSPPAQALRAPAVEPADQRAAGIREHAAVTPPSATRQPAFMEAPPAPTAQEWALAATYTLKNSKRYRYAWGQQVRSLMGTAVEGPDQGQVRLRVEIAADGSLARLETLWTTSAVAERLARQAVESMPRLPPTPTGKPLIFERTISFQPFAGDAPPIYANDCDPDPPRFQDPFAWDGKSPQVQLEPQLAGKQDPQALEECRKLLAQDSIEAESAHDQRQFDRWGSSKLAR